MIDALKGDLAKIGREHEADSLKIDRIRNA
jgi:hypothetical protein